MDLVSAFVYDVECAFARKREVTLVTMDVQGAFDALLPRRLLKRMQDQGWPVPLLKMIRSFLQERKVMVRLEDAYTDESRVQCGTPQGSPLSPVLYMLYLAELLIQDQALRFGYADDIALYRIGNTLEENVTAITQDVRRIEAWGLANKVAFAPEKLEMMHFTRRRHAHAPEAVISPTLTIQPTTSAPGDTKQPALRWLRNKETAAASFNDWWNALPPNTVTIFSDGSESYDDAGKHVGYGYAIYQGQGLVATGKGAINTLSHVFDAEAIGALKGLQKALTLPSNADTQRWLCIDKSHRLIDRHAVNIRWSPGHQGITGNEAADSLADAGAKSDIVDPGPTAQPTISGIGSIARSLAHNVTSGWWRKNEPTLSGGYRKWQLDYALKEPMELKLSRPTLHRLLALRSRHGDFEAYHKRFKHEDAETHCPCGKAKTPEHLVFCEISVRRFHSWPLKPVRPPTTAREGHDYIQRLLALPQEFERFVTTTRYFTFCNREPNGIPKQRST
ncbi:hypothetical protein DID88_006489 [Monilinia fructigena]|uniref:Reverse transcriptase domain-containing protein n=1 Tax=Monilinia fructigena TaxID=38457 RepID=A0A395IHE1_9HELO|nr:hypothetical protein DID88_006489 [Monilinia fructigena]